MNAEPIINPTSFINTPLMEVSRHLGIAPQHLMWLVDQLEWLNKNAQRAAIKRFFEAVERLAESNMLKTGKLEGSHYAAMKKIISEL